MREREDLQSVNVCEEFEKEEVFLLSSQESFVKDIEGAGEKL